MNWYFWKIVQLDLYNRIRKTNWWFACLCMIAITLFIFPDSSAGYAVLDINGYRGIYNSAWMGESLALVSSSFVLLFGYYLLSGFVAQEKTSQIQSLLLSSSFTINQYLSTKFVVNVLLLNIIGILMIAAAMLQQLIAQEQSTIYITSYILPYLVLILPVTIMVSCFALLFDILPEKIQKYSNLIYFFVWALLCTLNIFGLSAHSDFIRQMEQAAPSLTTGQTQHLSIGISKLNRIQETFNWQGVNYDISVFIPIVLQLLLGLVIFTITLRLANGPCHLLYQSKSNRFSTSTNPKKASSNSFALTDYLFTINSQYPLLNAELGMLSSHLNRSFWVIATCLFSVSLLVSLDTLRAVILAIIWLLPVVTVCQLSMCDERSETAVLLSGYRNQLSLRLTRVLAASIFTGLCCLGALIRFVIEGEFIAVLHLLGYCLLLPLGSVTCSMIFHSQKMFQLSFLFCWIASVVNHAPYSDLIGVTASSQGFSATWIANLTLFIMLIAYHANLFTMRCNFWYVKSKKAVVEYVKSGAH